MYQVYHNSLPDQLAALFETHNRLMTNYNLKCINHFSHVRCDSDIGRNNVRDSLRSWRYCKRTRNKVLAAEPTSERRSHQENGERSPPPKRYFTRAIPGRHTASYAGYVMDRAERELNPICHQGWIPPLNTNLDRPQKYWTKFNSKKRPVCVVTSNQSDFSYFDLPLFYIFLRCRVFQLRYFCANIGFN